ncbi:hypothetical protein [Frankia gtarii]|uniref:hypothetical protein n=1 Tax=Frankia gtarii TaxID=2950102 RepID=UPI0021BFAAA2|nr:hypothetical protein [Frankia gtarii]
MPTPYLPKCHPGWPGGILVLVEYTAEAVTSVDVQVGEPVTRDRPLPAGMMISRQGHHHIDLARAPGSCTATASGPSKSSTPPATSPPS